MAIVLFTFPRATTKVASPQLAAVAPKNYFDGMTIEGKAAYVYDLATQKVLYAKNEHQILPLASLTKLMTAVTASQTTPGSTIWPILTWGLLT